MTSKEKREKSQKKIEPGSIITTKPKAPTTKQRLDALVETVETYSDMFENLQIDLMNLEKKVQELSVLKSDVKSLSNKMVIAYNLRKKSGWFKSLFK